jgi:hypothetical protein
MGYFHISHHFFHVSRSGDRHFLVLIRGRGINIAGRIGLDQTTPCEIESIEGPTGYREVGQMLGLLSGE